MNKFAAIGLLIAAAAAGAIFYFNRGSQIRIEGSMKKVRMQKLYENSTLLVFDFRFSNPANFPFVVAEVTSECTLADGRKLEGELVTDADAKPIFAFHALTLGDKYNESLIRKSRVAPKTTEDRMIAMVYRTEPEPLEKRSGCVLRIRDVDGAVSTIAETPGARR
ncbi:MAG: hypothetical protein IT164_20395 [Bryobacterales bacterium]|nr:hypothetical protein [Bryobacterales bacterium]